MDKISAALIVCIMALVGINGMIIYNTWIDTEDAPHVVDILRESENVSDDTEHALTFNDDTSIKNIGDGKLWIRVKVVYNDEYSAADYEIVSDAAEAGLWKESDDGWYYYSEPLTGGKMTRPLIDRLLYNGQEAEHGTTGKFRIQAEAVDETWLAGMPDSGQQAFELFETVKINRSTGKYL